MTMLLSMATTLLCLLFSAVSIIIQSSSARTLVTPSPFHHNNHHHNHHKFTFLMQNVLNVTHPSPNPATTKVTSQIPFPKPIGFFPPNNGIPLPQSNPTTPHSTGFSMQTLDFSNIGISFPARAALQQMEFGSVTEIDEELLETSVMYGSLIVGKAKGVFVASSEDGTSHMMAMTTNFGTRESKNGLMFFGVFKKDVPESHIAVIGGTGKYKSANGYAVIKGVNAGPDVGTEQNRTNKLLLFRVYLS